MKRYFNGPMMLLGGLWSAWVIAPLVAASLPSSPMQLQWDIFNIAVFVVVLLPGWGPWVWLFRQRAAVQGHFVITWRRAPLLIHSITPQVVEVLASAQPSTLKLFPLAGMVTAILGAFLLSDPAHPLMIIRAHSAGLLSWLGVAAAIFFWIQSWRQRIVLDLQTATATVQTYEFGWLSSERSVALPQPIQAVHYSGTPGRRGYVTEHATHWESETGQDIVVWHVNWEEGAWFWTHLRAAGVAVVPRYRWQ